MSGDWALTPSDDPKADERAKAVIDTQTAHVARAYDYMLGGEANFEVDRQAAQRLSAVFPGGLETAKADIRAQRDFLGRAVRHLAVDCGVRQFLDVGTGIPNADNVLAVVREVAPDAKVVSVDNDPIVLAHAHTLLQGTEPGTTAFIDGDLRRPEGVVERAALTLDFARPVAVILVGILHSVPDADDPHGIVRRLMAATAPGSYLVVSHLPSDVAPAEMAQMSERSRSMMREPFVMRSHDEVAAFFDGLDVLPPGVAQAVDWGQEREPVPEGAWVTPLYGVVGRKP